MKKAILVTMAILVFLLGQLDEALAGKGGRGRGGYGGGNRIHHGGGGGGSFRKHSNPGKYVRSPHGQWRPNQHNKGWGRPPIIRRGDNKIHNDNRSYRYWNSTKNSDFGNTYNNNQRFSNRRTFNINKSRTNVDKSRNVVNNWGGGGGGDDSGGGFNPSDALSIFGSLAGAIGGGGNGGYEGNGGGYSPPGYSQTYNQAPYSYPPDGSYGYQSSDDSYGSYGNHEKSAYDSYCYYRKESYGYRRY